MAEPASWGWTRKWRRRLRHVNKPIMCVANKCDTRSARSAGRRVLQARLRQGRLRQRPAKPRTRASCCTSSRIACRPPGSAGRDAGRGRGLKLAIVGRRNTGKSTFINSLAESERVIVSEVPGTTRDSIDVRFERDGLTFLAIDTAGVRKKKSLQNDIEFYSLARAERSIRRADVVLLFLDAAQRVSKVDKQLAEYILEQHKPAIFVVNKWDLMTPMPTGKMGDYIRATFPSLDFVPIAFITAKAGKNVHAVLNLAQNLHKQASARVGTGDLNRVLRQALEAIAAAAAAEPPAEDLLRHAGRQSIRRPSCCSPMARSCSTTPISAICIKTIRDQLHFNDVPIKLYLRRRQREDQSSVEGIDAMPAEDTTTPKRRQKKGKFQKRQDAEVWKDV